MGESATGSGNLPDPLDPKSTTAAAGGTTDDLLAQLAGDEIDRLLAEADVEATGAPATQSVAAKDAAPPAVEGTPSVPPTAATPAGAAESPAPTLAAQIEPADATTTTATAEASSPSLDVQLDNLFDELKQAEAADAADPPTDVAAATTASATKAPASTDLDDQLARLADELLPDTEKEEAVTAVDAGTTAAVTTAPASEVPQPTPTEELAGERAALLQQDPAHHEPGLEDAARLGLEEDAPAPQEESAPAGPLPWYLKPLAWLNAPFASMSDHTLALMGKLAVATLLFSVTLLAYVAVVRHKM